MSTPYRDGSMPPDLTLQDLVTEEHIAIADLGGAIDIDLTDSSTGDAEPMPHRPALRLHTRRAPSWRRHPPAASFFTAPDRLAKRALPQPASFSDVADDDIGFTQNHGASDGIICRTLYKISVLSARACNTVRQVVVPMKFSG